MVGRVELELKEYNKKEIGQSTRRVVNRPE